MNSFGQLQVRLKSFRYLLVPAGSSWRLRFSTEESSADLVYDWIVSTYAVLHIIFSTATTYDELVLTVTLYYRVVSTARQVQFTTESPRQKTCLHIKLSTATV